MTENTTKFSKIRETKAYDETTLYSSSISFLKIAYNDIINIEKYPRECFGTHILNHIHGCFEEGERRWQDIKRAKRKIICS